jgi:hypothetical protein
MQTPPDNYGVARAALDMGIAAIPVLPGTKIPAVFWKRFQTELPTDDLLRGWFADTRGNIAILTTGMVLFDIDDPAKVELVLRECGETPHRVRTPRGGLHLGYRNPGIPIRNRVRVKGEPIDIRGDGGLEVIPNSVTEHGSYSWLGSGLNPIADLPVARIEWTLDHGRERARRALEELASFGEGKGSIRFPEAYCLRIESVQGSNGSRGLVRVVSVMRDAGRTRQQTFEFIKTVWGPACCRPEWSDAEIWHCIDRHFPAG